MTIKQLSNPKRVKCQYCGQRCKSPKSRATHERWCCKQKQTTTLPAPKDKTFVVETTIVPESSVRYTELAAESLNHSLSYLKQLAALVQSKIEAVETAIRSLDE